MVISKVNDVAIYCSKLSKVEISVEEQLERLKKYCKHFGINIVKEYIDIDNVNKPLFKQMVEDIKTKDFNIVLSYSFDTLTKNGNDLYSLLYELNKYNYELQLESSYIYKKVPKPLFKVPRNKDEEKEEKPKIRNKEKAKCYPMFREYEVKNPMADTPYNWVSLIGEDKFRFEEEPLFDNEGNYLGITRNAFVIFKEITGFCRTKTWKDEIERREKNKLKPKKLFNSNMQKRGEENE